MNVDIPSDHNSGDFEYVEEIDDSDVPQPPSPNARQVNLGFYIKCMLLVIVVGYGLVRAHNAFVVPLLDAFKEQAALLRENKINYENKCLDPKVKASYQGFDGCLAHETVITSGLYYPAFKLYMRKLDPCSEKGCLSVEMNAASWLTLILPLGFGIGMLLTIITLVLIVICVQRALSARYEFPDRMPSYGNKRWSSTPAVRTVVRRRATLDAPPVCART